MNKQDFLAELNTYIKSGIVSKDEVIGILNTNGIETPSNLVGQQVGVNKISEMKKSVSVANVFYWVGGLILMIGIAVMVSNYWSDLSSIVRVAITLGLSIIFFASGALISDENHLSTVSKIMQVISGILFPIGIATVISENGLSDIFKITVLAGISLITYILGIVMKSYFQSKIMQIVSASIFPVAIFVILDIMGVKDIGVGWITSIAFLLSFVYIVSFIFVDSIIFLFFAIAFSTWAMYSGLAYYISIMPAIARYDIYSYLTIIIGFCYVLLSSHYKKTIHKDLGKVLDLFGGLSIYSAIYKLGGYIPNQNILWEFIGVISVCLGLYLANISKNKIVLKIASLFALIFIGKFTGEYFVDSFGWPIALIIGGIAMITAGYVLIKFSKDIPEENKVV